MKTGINATVLFLL